MPIEGAIGEPARAASYGTCPRCGKYWQRYFGSVLLCHAACVFTNEEAAELIARLSRPPLISMAAIATEYGVPVSVVRAVWRKN